VVVLAQLDVEAVEQVDGEPAQGHVAEHRADLELDQALVAVPGAQLEVADQAVTTARDRLNRWR
jgi:hypothetical protein